MPAVIDLEKSPAAKIDGDCAGADPSINVILARLGPEERPNIAPRSIERRGCSEVDRPVGDVTDHRTVQQVIVAADLPREQHAILVVDLSRGSARGPEVVEI